MVSLVCQLIVGYISLPISAPKTEYSNTLDQLPIMCVDMCSLLIVVRCYAGMRCEMLKICRYTQTTATAKINGPCRNISTNLS